MGRTQFIKRSGSILLEKHGNNYLKMYTYRSFNIIEKFIYRLRGIKIIDWKR